MPDSYSKLINQLNSNKIKLLELIPKRNEVIVYYKDGTSSVIPVLYDDQNIIFQARVTNTPLTINNYRSEQAYANLISYLGILVIFFIGLSFLIKRATSILNSNLSIIGRKDIQVSPEKLNVRFEDIAGLKEAKEELKEIIEFIKNPEKLLKLGAKQPKGILIGGDPGTGKTLLAKALAGEADVPFYSISGSEFIELFVGVGSLKVRNLFQRARENSPSIIFIDEIDAIARQRGYGVGIGNDEQEQTLNQLLTEMDGFDEQSQVLVIAATNRLDVLDSAIRRPGRFDRTIIAYLPDQIERLESLGIHSRSIPLDMNVSLKDWARRSPGFSGADLKKLINESAIVAGRNNERLIKTNHIETAFDKISMGITNKLSNQECKLLIAYREVSRALIAYIISYPEQCDKLTILTNTSGQKGITRFMSNEDNIDNNYSTKSFLNSSIKVKLAPRAAEILIYGKNEVTQLSSYDLKEVENIARNMVERYGFSESVPIYIEKKMTSNLLDRSLFRNKKDYSEITIKKIDREIINTAKNALSECLSILSENRNELDSIVSLLIQEETFTSERFKSLISHFKISKIS